MNKDETLVETMNVQDQVDFVNPNTPICCENRAEWNKSCCAFVCDECEKHYINGSLANYCGIGCSWIRKGHGGFDPSYAGETL